MANTATTIERCIRAAALCGGVSGALLATTALQAAEIERAYSAEAPLSRVDRRNALFFTQFPIVGPTPAREGRITRVVYQWRYDNPPPGLRVELCQQDGPCADVSNSPSGQSSAFAGASPAHAFFMRVRVDSRSNFAPVLGRKAQVIVTWRE